MTGQVHSSCDANLGTSMMDLGLPRSKIQKSVENTAFHRTSTNCHPPRLPPGPFERPRQDAIFVAATFLSGGLGRAAKKENHFSPILACTHAFHCFSPTVDIQPSEPQQKLILGLFRNLCSGHIFGEVALPGKLPKRLVSVLEICAMLVLSRAPRRPRPPFWLPCHVGHLISPPNVGSAWSMHLSR
jgi:hypothetical protein